MSRDGSRIAETEESERSRHSDAGGLDQRSPGRGPVPGWSADQSRAVRVEALFYRFYRSLGFSGSFLCYE